MANGPQTVDQRILLILEEQINVGKVAQHLKAVASSGKNANKSLKTYTRTTDKATKVTKKLSKAGFILGSTLANVGKSLKSVLGTGTLVVGSFTILFHRLTKSNKAFMDMGIAVSDVDKTMARLHQRNKDVITSMQDAAETIGMFAKKSIAARAVLSQAPELEKSIDVIQDTLAKGLQDKGRAKEMMQGLVNALPAPMLKEVFSDPKIFGTGAMFDVIRSFDSDAGNMYEQMVNGMQKVGKSTDENIRGIKSWTGLMTRLSTVVDSAQTQFLAAFGSDGGGLADVMQSIEQEILPALMKGIKTLADWIRANGTKVAKVMSTIVGYLAKFIDYVVSMQPKYIALGAALLFPGVLSTIAMIGKTVLVLAGNLLMVSVNAGRAVLGVKAIGKAKFAGAISGLKGLTIGITAAAAAAHQFYIWKTKGAGATWGGKIADSLYDFKGKQDKANQENPFNSKRDKIIAKNAGISMKRMSEFRKSGSEQKLGEWLKSQGHAKEAAGTSKSGGLDVQKNVSIIDKLKSAWDKAKDALSKFAKQATDQGPGREFEKYKKQWERIAGGISGASSAAGSLETIMTMGGFNADVGGMTATEAAAMFGENLAVAAEEAKRIGIEMMRNARLVMQSGSSTPTQRTTAIKDYADGAAKLAEANKLVASQADLATARVRIQFDLTKQITDLHKADLEISKNLYGSASLAVEAQLAVVDSLQKQKSLKQQELASIDALINKEKKGSAESIELLKRRRNVQLDMKNITVEQVSLMKQLRDGYLDAVQAQAFGAGKFEKILITQDKNLAMSLDKRIAKQNIMHGQTGKAARQYDLKSSQFTATGTGDMKGRSQDFVDNIANANAKALAQHSVNIFSGVTGATDSNTQALNQNTDVLNNYINKGLKGAGVGALKGSAAGSVAVGEAMGGSPPTLRAVNYKGSSSIKSSKLMQEYRSLTKRINSAQQSSIRGGANSFDMRTPGEVKRARAQNKAAIGKLEHRREIVRKRMAKNATGVARSGKARGDMENIGTKAKELFIHLGQLMTQWGAGVDRAQAEQEQAGGRMANQIPGGSTRP